MLRDSRDALGTRFLETRLDADGSLREAGLPITFDSRIGTERHSVATESVLGGPVGDHPFE